MAARDLSVPNVMICPTESRPYFSRTYSMTSPRRSSQKSTSMSGIEMRSGLRKRSKSRSYLSGQTSVMLQRVGDDGAGGGAAPRAHGDAAVARRLDEVGDDEEVAGVARLGDDVELVVEALPHVGAASGCRSAATAPSVASCTSSSFSVFTPLGSGKLGRWYFLPNCTSTWSAILSVFSRTSGRSAKCGAHLGGALEEEPAVVAHAIGVGAVLLEADAEQHVVRVVVLGAQEVRVVGGDDREVQLAGEREDALVEDALVAGVVGLDLEVVAVLEDVGVPFSRLAGVVVAVVQQVGGHLAGHARRGDDDPLAILGEDFAVDAGLAVESLGIGERGELHQIAVAGEILGEEDEVVVVALARTAARAGAPVVGSDVRLHAENGAETGLLGLLLELPRGVQVTVIGDGEGWLFELQRPRDQVVDPVRSIEKRELGMAMQVNERHRTNKDSAGTGRRQSGFLAARSA